MESAAVNVIAAMAALIALIVFLVIAYKALAASFAAFATVVAWIASTGAGFVLAFLLVTSLRIFWRNLGQVVATLINTIWSALLFFLAAVFSTLVSLRRQTDVIRFLLSEDEPGTSAAFPDGRWPNPTQDQEFPHMVRARDGWRIETLGIYSNVPRPR
jgi:hypothetical protein